MQKVLPIVSILFWFTFGLYLAIGGTNRIDTDSELTRLESKKSELSKDSIFLYDEIQFVNKFDWHKYLHKKKIKQKNESIAWFFELSVFVVTIIVSCAFGLLGGITDLIRQVVNGSDLANTKYFSIPLLACLSGISILGLTYLIPSVLVVDDKGLRIQTLMFLCFYGGLNCVTLYAKLAEYFKKMLP